MCSFVRAANLVIEYFGILAMNFCLIKKFIRQIANLLMR